MINSITLESDRLEGILPLVSEYNAKVIALCQTGASIAESMEDKVKLAGQLVEKVTSSGIALDDLYIDPYTPSALTSNPQEPHCMQLSTS